MYERSGLHFLEIKEVCMDDGGSYTCSVTNAAGTATATAELHIQGELTDQRSGSSSIALSESCLIINDRGVNVSPAVSPPQVLLMTPPGEFFRLPTP